MCYVRMYFYSIVYLTYSPLRLPHIEEDSIKDISVFVSCNILCSSKQCLYRPADDELV